MQNRIGKWTVVNPDAPGERVLVRCECGTERRIRRRNLLTGRSNSCGCDRGALLRGVTWNTDLAPERADEVVPGARFGRWTVLEGTRVDYRGHRRTALCRCECGTERDVATNNLLKGASRSCGCLNCEVTRARWAAARKA